jgi:hypothetical protein
VAVHRRQHLLFSHCLRPEYLWVVDLPAALLSVTTCVSVYITMGPAMPRGLVFCGYPAPAKLMKVSGSHLSAHQPG